MSSAVSINPSTGQPYGEAVIVDETSGIPLHINSDGSGFVNLAVSSALAAWSSQPTQTATAAADTLLKWGSSGNATPTRLTMQNNSSVTLYYAFDADSTASTSPVYTLAAGQFISWDRTFSVLHCHSASQVAFGGTSGFTMEAFA